MARRNSLRSLRIHNYRRYFAGQVLSLCGTWAQQIGMGWLVLRLSHNSGVAIGVVTAMQALPVLAFGLWAGLLADRFDKRRFIVTTQVALALTAGLLAAVDLSGVARLWIVYVLAFLFGTATACDTPARLSFVVEMVGPDDLPNALALNSTVVNGGRIVGPAIAGLVIAAGGTGLCFLVNAVSYVGTIIAVATMRRDELQQPPPVARAKGQIRAGFHYARHERVLRANLLMLAMTSVLASNFPVVLPLMAKLTFHGNASTYSLMASAMGAGAFIGAMCLTTMDRPYGRRIARAAAVAGVAILVASSAPSLAVLIAVLPIVGLAQFVTGTSTNALIQLDAAPAMRGRMTALFSLTSGGMTPAGGLLIGSIAQAFGPRVAMGVGGVGTLVAVALFAGPLRHHRPPPRTAPPLVVDEQPVLG